MKNKKLLLLILIGLAILITLLIVGKNSKPNLVNEIGVEQNKNEDIYIYPNRLNFGELKEAPLASIPQNKDIDILAHWYNDFGLESTASSHNRSNGSYTWYDWSWNHTNNPNYDSSRHPLLGWYKGDDPTVLDWQSYWLVEYGVTGTIITGAINKDNFYQPSEKMYWANVLFEKVKNFKKLKYVLWLEGNHKVSKQAANDQQDFVINKIVAKHDNIYTYKVNGKTYPVFFIWDMEGFRGTYDNYKGSETSRNRMIYLSGRMKQLGYDGIVILGRNLVISSSSYTEQQMEDLKNQGVYLLAGGYSNLYNNKEGTGYNDSYENYAKTVDFPKARNNVINVLTSAESKPPHPSNWTIRGSNPRLFKTVLERAVEHIEVNQMPNFLTVYNVSEWAEGGPGLQPNKRDGFGYLEAVEQVSIDESN